MADGLRAMNLKPDLPKTHICYIQALKAAGLEKRSEAAVDRYHSRFPLQRDELRRSLERCRCHACSLEEPLSLCVCVRVFSMSSES